MLAKSLILGFIGGVAGAVASVPALFLCASCCSGSIVSEKSFLGAILGVISMPGSALAGQVDRSGGWLSFWAYVGGSFAAWGALSWCISAVVLKLTGRRDA